MTELRVVIADDQKLVRAGFGMILSAQPEIEVVGEAGDGAEAIRLVRAARPDVVLMDVRMPELDELAATRELLSEGPAGRHVPKILILTTFDVDDYVYEALAAGASGFLLKDTPAEQLVEAVRSAAAGESLLAPTVTRRLIEHFVSSRAMREQPPNGLDELTPRELEVFKLIAAGLSNTEIAGELVVSEATVKRTWRVSCSSSACATASKWW
jgi:DNA-binding NarL/FixJ family response regulator